MLCTNTVGSSTHLSRYIHKSVIAVGLGLCLAKHTNTSSLFCNMWFVFHIQKNRKTFSCWAKAYGALCFLCDEKGWSKDGIYCNIVVLFMNTRPLISFFCVFVLLFGFFPQVSQLENKEMGSCWEISGDNHNNNTMDIYWSIRYKHAVRLGLSLPLSFCSWCYRPAYVNRVILMPCYLPYN